MSATWSTFIRHNHKRGWWNAMAVVITLLAACTYSLASSYLYGVDSAMVTIIMWISYMVNYCCIDGLASMFCLGWLNLRSEEVISYGMTAKRHRLSIIYTCSRVEWSLNGRFDLIDCGEHTTTIVSVHECFLIRLLLSWRTEWVGWITDAMYWQVTLIPAGGQCVDIDWSIKLAMGTDALKSGQMLTR